MRPELGSEPYRKEWRRDYARLIHCPAFRRLQGKTQVFPGVESDFFRNRLTHSLEVAQIGRSLAIRLNHTVGSDPDNTIDPDLVELAGLAHDLGHPPFGHNGEDALDGCMRGCGGFEGNAQTLRIVGRIEKKEVLGQSLKGDPEPCGVTRAGKDTRIGLNWAYRSLASILKYDKEIPRYRESDGVVKGYYHTESSLVRRIKKAVMPSPIKNHKFKTIECSLMDIADDIAYSTYDLEDTFKAGFLSPLDILSSNGDIIQRVADNVSKATGVSTDQKDVMGIFLRVLGRAFDGLNSIESIDNVNSALYLTTQYLTASRQFAQIGYLRTKFTADLVSRFMSGVSLDYNRQEPSQSKVKIAQEILLEIEALKHYTFEATIMSPRLRISEKRGADIVREIFDELSKSGGERYLPSDCRTLFSRQSDDEVKKRVICDFIAGMTDRYAIEFHGRMFSDDPESIFKPF